MNPEELRAKFPLILNWIQQTLSTHAARARPVASLNFPRLRSYFTPATLDAARVVAVDTVPLPPLTALGLTGFTDFENTDAIGITYLDTFFVQADCQDNESLHFHELVHIVQWNLLGPERFLAIYAEGLEQFGYRDSPLEEMAYRLEALFGKGGAPFPVEQIVGRELNELVAI